MVGYSYELELLINHHFTGIVRLILDYTTGCCLVHMHMTKNQKEKKKIINLYPEGTVSTISRTSESVRIIEWQYGLR